MRDIVLSEDDVWKGSFFRIKRQRIRSAEGKYFFREVAERDDGVAVVPIQPDGKVLMIREYAAGSKQALLFIPGGTTKATTESQRQQEAQRELREEVGLRANKLVKLWQTFEAPAMLTRRIHIYLGFDLVPDSLSTGDVDEEITSISMTIDEAIRQTSAVDGSSASTVGALLLAQAYIAKAGYNQPR